MASVRKFEDLICWKKARELANFVFNITDKPSFRDFDLKRQIRRASISPMSNIAEGFDRGTRAEFVDALFIAKGETGEVRSQLYISFDRRYVTELELEKGLKLCDECSRLIQSFADKVKGGSHRGLQFKQVAKPDPIRDITKEHSPELYERFYGQNK
ncbi:four helix bundle protein [Patescibacteria group bacterium]|nr:four helix bundle protein [Patescibacteria group bacterium]MBU2219390.1 four helix bundle protein [Patescibacteria group bacterium]MBU2263141.1 four helix bundle protein [Patescibacteria group bacterium]